MIRGRKFPMLPCVLVRNALECTFRIREMSRDGGGRFPCSSFLILNFLLVYFQVPDLSFLLPFPFVTVALLSTLPLAVCSAASLPICLFLHTFSFFYSVVLGVSDQIRERTSGTDREEGEKQGHTAAKFHFFLPPALNSADETGSTDCPPPPQSRKVWH